MRSRSRDWTKIFTDWPFTEKVRRSLFYATVRLYVQDALESLTGVENAVPALKE